MGPDALRLCSKLAKKRVFCVVFCKFLGCRAPFHPYLLHVQLGLIIDGPHHRYLRPWVMHLGLGSCFAVAS